MSESSPASTRLASSRCPACGAPVDWRDAPADQLQVKCGYCGTLITIPGRQATLPAASLKSHAMPPPGVVVSSDGRVIKGGWGCRLAGGILVAILVLMAGIFILIEYNVGAVSQMLHWTR